MIVHKKTPKGDVVRATNMDTEGYDFAGITLSVNEKMIGSLEGDQNEIRLLLDDDAIAKLGLKVIHLKDKAALQAYKV